MKTDFQQNIRSFAGLRILVAGDLLLDHYISGTTERTSPEAPVPVVLVGEETWLAGGAANVARNLKTAGADAACAGMIGEDQAGQTLLGLLTEAGVDTGSIVQLPDCNTIVKARVVSQGQQIVRLDYEKPWAGNHNDLLPVCTAIGQGLSDLDAVIVSDYGKGYFRREVMGKLLAGCSERKIPVFVDPKGRDFNRYIGAFAITPNSREAAEATGISTATTDGLRDAAEAIHKVTRCPLVIITRGADGLALRTQDGRLTLIPTSAREVFDVTGAGDTFIAWLTLGITSGLSPEDAASLANIAAGISVGRSGPAVVSPLDIRQALAPGRTGKKIILEKALGELHDQLRASGRKIVLANGCFDFLHAGHVAFLQQAKNLGDVLVVATNSDESITRLKGRGRPVIAQSQREELLASIEAVDFVTVFQGDTPHDVITQLRPDVLVKGSNYTLNEVEGAQLVKDAGGEVVTLPILHDFHTGQLVKPKE